MIPHAIRVPKKYILSMLERGWSEKSLKGYCGVFFALMIPKVGPMALGTCAGLGGI